MHELTRQLRRVYPSVKSVMTQIDGGMVTDVSFKELETLKSLKSVIDTSKTAAAAKQSKTTTPKKEPTTPETKDKTTRQG